MEKVGESTLLEDVPKEELGHNVLLNLVGNGLEDFYVVVNHSDPVILPVVFKVVLDVFPQLRSYVFGVTSRLVSYPIAES